MSENDPHDAPAAGDGAPGKPLPQASEDPAGEVQSGEVDRRGFLELAGLCLGACAGASALGVVGAAVVGTPLSVEATGQEGWFDLGPLTRFPDAGAKKVPVRGEARDAFLRFSDRSVGRVVVVRDGEQVRAFSARCPHNGCDVYVGEAELICPCHDSGFDLLSGERTRGDTPRGLDPLETELSEGRLRVRYQRFELGTSERRPV